MLHVSVPSPFHLRSVRLCSQIGWCRWIQLRRFWRPGWSRIGITKAFRILTFWHRSFTFNSNKSPTSCNRFSVYYPDVCLQLNMFRGVSRPSSGAQWLQWQPLLLPRTQHDCHHDKKVKPEAATSVTELLMMGGKTPKTCWAVNKR